METVQLKNGTTELRALVNITIFTLRSLIKESPLALYELVELCKDRDHEVFSDVLGDDLKARSLIQSDGRVHGSIRNIVLSAVTGDGLSMELGSPLGVGQGRVGDGAIGAMPS